MRSHKLVIMIILLSGLECKLPTPDDDPSLVTNLRFAPSAFDSFRRNTELKYTLKIPSTVSVYIVKRDSSDREVLVKTLVENVEETKGTHSVTWLGDTNQRWFAPTGTYLGLVHINGRHFETTVQVFHF